MERCYGDPMLMEEDFDEMNYQDSTTTKIREVLPRGGKRFLFEYEYDFGDSWSHEVLFEGCPRAEPGCRYPLCVEGERACPPEDIGGTSGYRGFPRKPGRSSNTKITRVLSSGSAAASIPRNSTP